LLNFCGFAPPADSVEGQGSNTIRESLLAGEGGVGVCLFHFLKRANSCSTDVDVLVRPDGSRWLSGHRAGGTVAYEGVPLVPSATSTNYFFGVRDPKKIEKMDNEERQNLLNDLIDFGIENLSDEDKKLLPLLAK
jgi:hypothetical protein